MSDFKVLSFNHTNFTIADLDRGIAVLRDLLGFELISRAPRDTRLIERITGIANAEIEVAFLRGPGHTIELITYSAPADRGSYLPRMCDSGAMHVAFNVDNAEAAVAASADYGFELMGEIITIDAGPNKGSKVVYVRSTDGMTVEFIEKNTDNS